MRGTRGPVIVVGLREVFGASVATIYGTIYSMNALGAAFGSYVGKVLHDLTGGYRGGLVFALVFIAIAATPFWAIHPLRTFHMIERMRCHRSRRPHPRRSAAPFFGHDDARFAARDGGGRESIFTMRAAEQERERDAAGRAVRRAHEIKRAAHRADVARACGLAVHPGR